MDKSPLLLYPNEDINTVQLSTRVCLFKRHYPFGLSLTKLPRTAKFVYKGTSHNVNCWPSCYHATRELHDGHSLDSGYQVSVFAVSPRGFKILPTQENEFTRLEAFLS